MRILVTLLAASALATSLQAQVTPDQDEEKPEVVVRPGTGPQIPFDEARWEFWWYFNREQYVRLRPALHAHAANAVESDEPFYRLTQDDREQSVLPILMRALRDPNPEVRIAALQALAKTQDQGARVLLRSMLYDEHFQVRLHTLIAFGVFGASFFLNQLEDTVSDGTLTLQERFYAALSIGLIGGPQVNETFKQLLAPPAFRGRDTQIQIALAYAVGLARSPDNAPLVRALLGDRAVTDPVVRSYLTLSLGKCGDPADVTRLVDGLESQETQVRRSAAIGLGVLLAKSDDADLVGEATKALKDAARKDADVMVRNFAYIALGQIGGEEAARILRADLEGTTKTHRPFVALALGILGDPESLPLLIRMFEKEREVSYRAALAVALGLHRDARAAPALRKAFDEQLDPVFRGYCALATGLVGDVEAVDRLERIFESATDVELLPNVATALGLLGSRQGAERLAARALAEKNEFVKQSLIYSLGLIGDRTAIDPLKEMLLDSSQPAYVRAYAATALGQIADPQPIRGIARLTVDSNYTVRSDFLRELFRVL